MRALLNWIWIPLLSQSAFYIPRTYIHMRTDGGMDWYMRVVQQDAKSKPQFIVQIFPLRGVFFLPLWNLWSQNPRRNLVKSNLWMPCRAPPPWLTPQSTHVICDLRFLWHRPTFVHIKFGQSGLSHRSPQCKKPTATTQLRENVTRTGWLQADYAYAYEYLPVFYIWRLSAMLLDPNWMTTDPNRMENNVLGWLMVLILQPIMVSGLTFW